eukprot:5390442-Karenia_brevis.AAC.1
MKAATKSVKNEHRLTKKPMNILLLWTQVHTCMSDQLLNLLRLTLWSPARIIFPYGRMAVMVV